MCTLSGDKPPHSGIDWRGHIDMDVINGALRTMVSDNNTVASPSLPLIYTLTHIIVSLLVSSPRSALYTAFAMYSLPRMPTTDLFVLVKQNL